MDTRASKQTLLEETGRQLIRGTFEEEHRLMLLSTLDVRHFKGLDYLHMLVVKHMPRRGVLSAKLGQIWLEGHRGEWIEEMRGINPISNIANAELWQLHIRDYVGYMGEVEKDPLLSLEEYETAISMYQNLYVQLEMEVTLNKGLEYLQVGVYERGKNQVGYEATRDYLRRQLIVLDQVSNSQGAGSGLIDAKTHKREIEKLVKVGDFGLIRQFNEHFQGIYGGLFYSFLAPSKAGKSKIMTKLVDRCLHYGSNVLVWPVEGGVDLWLSGFQACHYTAYYKEDSDKVMNVPRVTQGAIFRGEPPLSDEQATLLRVSDADWSTSGEYGGLYILDEEFHIRDFEDKLEGYLVQTKAQVLLIDYIQMIGFDGDMTKQQAITKAYQLLLRICRKHKVALLAPAQYSQEFMKTIKADGTGGDMRLSAGESSEVVRSPDVLIAMYATEEDISNKKMTFKSMPSRLYEPFKEFSIYADLGDYTFMTYQV